MGLIIFILYTRFGNWFFMFILYTSLGMGLIMFILYTSFVNVFDYVHTVQYLLEFV